MATLISRDVQDIVSKLSSDKAKSRDEGVNLLNTWLKGERSLDFCRFLTRKTAKLKPDRIPGSDTWPFLITLIIDCINKEILSSKKKPPKIVYAKTLKIVVQRAEDGSGHYLPLITIAKALFNHIWDVLKDVPSFHSEYGTILRHVLTVKDYRFHMKKRVYCGFVLFYMEKIEASLSEKHSGHSNLKEEDFRCILTLHSLLENPPGDFPENIREDVVKGFIGIFAFMTMREEVKVSRKLIECLNMYLLEDGPNLGSQSLDVHNSVKHFVFHFWPTTHDQGLKDAFILYAKLQLNLSRDNEDSGPLVDQLLHVVGRELDLCSTPGVSASCYPLRFDNAKHEKFGTNLHHNLLELAALVFYRAIVGVIKLPSAEKRARRENAATYLKEELMTRKWLWHAAFCYLCHKYHGRLAQDLFTYWFDGICSSLERMISDSNADHLYDGLLWTLRSLQQLFLLLLPLTSTEKVSQKLNSVSKKIGQGWQTVWSCLVHGFPMFSNVSSVADAAFKLLGNMVTHDILNVIAVPQDLWDLQCFKHISSVSALYFISCYFSRKGSQGDLRDNLHLRQNMLRGITSIFNAKVLESLNLDQDYVVLLPAAVYAVCTGFSDIQDLGLSLFRCSLDAARMPSRWCKGDQPRHEEISENFECFVNVLADINISPLDEVPLSNKTQCVRLPRQLWEPLLHEMENCILLDLVNKKKENNSFTDVVLDCALVSNFLYYSYRTRTKEISPFGSKLSKFLLDLLEYAISMIQDSSRDVKSHGILSSYSKFDGSSLVVVSFKLLLSCPIFISNDREDLVDHVLYSSIVHCFEKLLKALCSLYVELSSHERIQLSETVTCEVSASNSPVGKSVQSSKSLLIDADLDMGDVSSEVVSGGGGISGGGSHFSGLSWRIDLLSLMSCCFPLLPITAWNILFEILSTESNPKVCEKIISSLCQNIPGSSLEKLITLVSMMDEMIELKLFLRLHCSDILQSICYLLASLLSLHYENNKHGGLSLKERDAGQGLIALGDLVSKVFDSNLLDWRGRVKMVDCICDFISLNPSIGQTMIQRLLIVLRDPDFRVRFSLARQVGILFLTWDGHDDLFQDICSNFGSKLIISSKEKVVTAKEVLSAGSQARTSVETIVITLMHVACHSEKVELEAVFMICTISAIYPCQRELVKAVLDNLAVQLQYTCRSKYLEELISPLLFSWVSCGVSLTALVEIRDIFVLDVEANHFMLYCCQWLLPALVLHGDSSGLQWVAEVTRQPLATLVRSHFVQVFSVCMLLHCSKKSGWEKGSAVLQRKILQLADISEEERDKLIKRHMVKIASEMFGLASSASETALPLFPRETVELAVRTVVDGFLELENYQTGEGVVDKINIFRPDRVFMLLVEMHYKVTAAINQRHKSLRLAGIEVLINILGHRVAVSSTSCYLFNLVGQFISSKALQDQCCRMISILLKTFKNNPSKETTHVLGEQIQFLVSKLVACCIPMEGGEYSGTTSPQVMSLLNLLTLDADPSLHEYIKEFEPFPELAIFDRIRTFHFELCRAYSLRVHFLKFVKRSCYLPPRLLLWSLQALHKKLLSGEIYEAGMNEESNACSYWQSDQEIAHAVWSLVRTCGTDEADDARALVSDFISKVGIGDPRSVVFHVPGSSGYIHVCGAVDCNGVFGLSLKVDDGTVISEELLLALIRILKKYLMDDSVKIVDLSSQTLRAILSTERGNRVLGSFDSYERSLIEVHSKGVNVQMVESVLFDLQKKFTAEGTSVEDELLWSTSDKTFDSWICPLAHSLVGHCNDVILRMFQDLVLLKAEIAEILLPCILINLAGRKDLTVDFCKLISVQVEKHILVKTNNLIKSIQVVLDALNELRLCYIMERAATLVSPNKQESVKFSRSSSGHSAKSRRSRESAPSKSAGVVSTALWDKVYWLTMDYLTVAKSAILCGSYFTAMMYVEYWCDDHFNNLTLGKPDFSHFETLPSHIEILLTALTRINEPDSLYGVIQSHQLSSQIVTFEHEGNWSKALEYYDLQVRSEAMADLSNQNFQSTSCPSFSMMELEFKRKKPYEGVIRSLQKIGCAHILDLYCQGLVSRKGEVQHDMEFLELQYEAAWRAGNWDFSLFHIGNNSIVSNQHIGSYPFHQNLHCCLRALQEGDSSEFYRQLKDSKQELVLSLSHASEERTEYIYSTIVKLQILDHLGTVWDLRWAPSSRSVNSYTQKHDTFSEPAVPTIDQFSGLNTEWSCILNQTKMHMNLLEPFVAFRRVLLQILGCSDSTLQHLLQSSSVLRKGLMFSQAAASLHEFKIMCMELNGQHANLYWLGRLEEAKLLRAQGQQQMAINLGKYIAENNLSSDESADVHRVVGKWLAEARSSNSRTILEKYLKLAVSFAEENKGVGRQSLDRKCRTHFHLAHYADALFQNHEERLASSEWQAAMRLRKHKKMELEALIKRLKSSTKGEKIDYSLKIQELQKQLAMDTEEAEKLQDDRDNFLRLALEGYKRCLIIGDKYDVRVVFRLVSLWFDLSSRQQVVIAMINTVKEVQSYKFIPLVYQIASRMGSTKEVQGPHSFQFALVSLVKKMAIDHPYHTIFQLLALANGDRIKDKQRSRNSFVVDIDKKVAAEKLLQELSSYHGTIIRQMKQMVEIYIRLAELETKREDTNKKVNLPRDIRSVRELELVPVITSNFPVDRSCQYLEGTFPHFKGLADSVVVMNGINAPKVVECYGSDGKIYKQLAKSGNDDLRQDAVMEQFFGLVNTFLHNNGDTWRRKLGVRTYKVVPFTPSAGVIEWVDGTVPLGEYLIGSSRNGGAHGHYGVGDWSFSKCREHMMNAKDKRKAFQEVCKNFRPVMHYFFLERFLQPADWFEKRLAYTRSVATSSMVGYIVGLGDRHSMNILIDQATAEVVHIDLGVAFEQGLMLKTPERVPFRLTRDIIDGMGVTGVEGVFRRCCEETLAVMRTNKEALLTIIEVFIHDPLYKWALSPLKALQRQKDTEDDLETSWEDSQDEHEGNKDAARALMRVKQKLDGYEDGEMRSVHGQVQQLIQDAIDPERLCNMFPGWGAWM